MIADKKTQVAPAVDEHVEILRGLIRVLVDEPDGVHVSPVCGSRSVIFEVEVCREDVRRLIGRKGRTADAIREILFNLGARYGWRYNLEVVEPPPHS